MAEGYISSVECAGGCGVLLPQHLVDRGRRYLWGHKNGCPADGEPPRRKPRTSSPHGSDVGGRAAGAVQHTSYANTLAMAVANVRALRASRATAVEERELHLGRAAAITSIIQCVDEGLARELAVVRALHLSGAPGCGTDEVMELLSEERREVAE